MKNPKRLRLWGRLGGLLLILLATTQLVTSYRQGNPQWFYLVMVCGMVIILYPSFFKNRK